MGVATLETSTKRRTGGKDAARFIEACCVHPEGDLVGRPLILHPWWKRRLYELLELLPRSCPECGAQETFADQHGDELRCLTCGRDVELPPDERRYSEAYISTAKKSAKSTVTAALGLWLLADDGDDAALGICAATTEKQSANLMFGSAKYMVENSPLLREVIEPFQDEIRVKGTRSRLRNVTSAVGTNDGPIIKFVLADELHEWRGQRGRDLFTVLSKGCTRRNALFVSVTTAGFDEDSICYERYDYGRKVAAGEVEDPRFYFYCAELPADADSRDKSLWHIANPLLGVTPTISYLETQLLRNPLSAWERYNCNRWVAGEEIWIPYGVWDEGFSPRALDPTLPLYVGIDMAKTIDATAVALVQPQPTDDPERAVYVVRARIWENPYPEGHSARAGWRMNNHEVVQLCRELFAQYPKPAAETDGRVMPGPAFCFDPWRFRTEADLLDGEGLNMVEVPQCLDPETAVLLANGGTVRAGAVEVGDEVIGQDNERGKITAVTPQNAARCLQVETKAGRSITVTDNHPFLVRRRFTEGYRSETWLRADQLRPSDRLMLALGYAIEKPSTMSPIEAWELGLFLGDGDLRLGRVASRTPEITQRLAACGQCTIRDGYVDVHGARGWLRDHGLNGERSWEKFVPTTVLTDGAEAQAAFLAGYLDADGTVRDAALRGRVQIRWASTSRKLLTDCQQMLAGLGIPASILARTIYHDHGAWRPAFDLQIGGRVPCRTFWEVAAPWVVHPEKRARLAKLAALPVSEYQDKLIRRREADPVTVVSEVGERETIGLTVDIGTHVTAGIVTHNTDVHMVPASQTLFEAIINRQIAHDGDAALKRHIHNTTARARERGWRIDRPEGTRRPNDATVALAIALDQAQHGAPAPVGIMFI